MLFFKFYVVLHKKKKYIAIVDSIVEKIWFAYILIPAALLQPPPSAY